MLQAPMLDGLSLGPFSLFDDGFCSAEVDVGRCHVVEAFVVKLVVVMLDERFDLDLEIAGQGVVFEQHPVLQCLNASVRSYLGFADGRARRAHGSCCWP